MKIQSTIKSVVLTTIVAGWGLTGRAVAGDVEIGDLRYTLNEAARTATLIGIVNSTTSGIDCDRFQVDGVEYVVTKVGSDAAFNVRGLSRVSLPDVTEIGSTAFAGNNHLATVSVPAVRKIGDWAFLGYNDIKEITLPRVTEIGAHAFEMCDDLKAVVLPGDVVPTVGADAFKDIPEDAKVYVNPTAGFPAEGSTWQGLEVVHLKGVTVNGRDVALGSGEGWTLENGVVTLQGERPFVLSGSNTKDDVRVAVKTAATVTLDNLVLTSCRPLVIGAGCTATILLKGENVLTVTEENYAALHPYQGSVLTIDRASGCTDAEAALTANGARYGAGLGCGRYEQLGNIEIKGGTIRATGGWYAAGIGGGFGGGAGGETVAGETPRAEVRISGGTVWARGGLSAPGIGTGYAGWGVNVRISGGLVTAETGSTGPGGAADIGALTTGDSIQSRMSVEISGGTVKADALGTKAETDTSVTVTITGGNVMAKTVFAAPTDGERRVYCVTVPGDWQTGRQISFAQLPAGYGTQDIVSTDGNVYLWLPTGEYRLEAAYERFTADVADAATTATKGWKMGLFVNGTEVGIGTGADWTYEFDDIVLDGAGPFVISGSNTEDNVRIVQKSDATVTLDNLVLKSSAMRCSTYEIKKDVKATILLKGTNEIVCASTAPTGSQAGIFVPKGAALTLDAAPGLANDAAALTVCGGTHGAAIGGGSATGVGRIEIRGGLIRATAGDSSAAIGGGNPEAGEVDGEIVINGGFVYAKGNPGIPLIGASRSNTGGAGYSITIAGGTIVAMGFAARGVDSGNPGKPVLITGGGLMGGVDNPVNAKGETVWSVLLPEGSWERGTVLMFEGLGDYGQNDVTTFFGMTSIWLPDGEYAFRASGDGFYAKVLDASTVATRTTWTLGEGVTGSWSDGVVTIVGTGKIDDFEDVYDIPWHNLDVKAITLPSTVTLGENFVLGLADTVTVNGATLALMRQLVGGDAIIGGLTPAGAKAIKVKDGKVKLTVQVETTGDLGEGAKWRPAAVEGGELTKDGDGVELTLPAAAEKGFYILKTK